MKFTKAVLAASVASMASAQCSIKSGQISTIGPLVQAWKLYNFQLTKNAALDVKIDAANQAKAAKDAVISGAHADVAAGHAAAEGTAQGEVSAERGAALAAQATKFDAAQGAIQASYDSAASAAQGRHDSRVAEFEAQIAVLNAKKADAESRHSANTGSTGEVSTQRAADANAKANSAKAEVSARQSRVAAKLQANSDSVAARYDARLANEVSRLNAKYAAVGNKIQGKKYDVEATLAHLDNAGAGGIAYADNCIVAASDAIDMVKAGMMPNEIWYQVVIQGNSAARAAYVAPTAEPTDAPTTSEPTAQPTEALTGIAAAIVNRGWRAESTVRTYNAESLRNTAIYHIEKDTDWSTSHLQALNDYEILQHAEGTSRLLPPGASFRQDLCDEIKVSGAGKTEVNGVYTRTADRTYRDDISPAQFSRWYKGSAANGVIWFVNNQQLAPNHLDFGWGLSYQHHHRYFNQQSGNVVNGLNLIRTDYGHATGPAPVLQCTNYRYFDEGNAAPHITCSAKLVAPWQSSTYAGYGAGYLVDGNHDSIAHTNAGGWQWSRVHVFLGGNIQLSKIRIVNRRDCCKERLGYHEVWVGPNHTAPNAYGNKIVGAKSANSGTVFEDFGVATGKQGTYVFLFQADGTYRFMNIAEIEATYVCA